MSPEFLNYICKPEGEDYELNAFMCEDTLISSGHINDELKRQSTLVFPKHKKPQSVTVYEERASHTYSFVGLTHTEISFSLNTFNIKVGTFAEKIDKGQKVICLGCKPGPGLQATYFINPGAIVEINKKKVGPTNRFLEVIIRYLSDPIGGMSGSQIVNQNGETLGVHAGLDPMGQPRGAIFINSSYRYQMQELRKYHGTERVDAPQGRLRFISPANDLFIAD